MSTIDTTVQYGTAVDSLRECRCCGVHTSVTCINGACLICHSGGLCHD